MNTASYISTTVVVLLSGGLDSTACVSFYKRHAARISGLFINYNQPALAEESAAASAIAKYFNIPLNIVEISGVEQKHDGELKGRNAAFIFTALMGARIEKGIIAIGIHAGTPYYDCSAHFIESIQVLLQGYTNGAIRIAAPFIDFEKHEIWHFAKANNSPIDLTYSCERAGPYPCLECPSCRDRMKLNAL